MARKPKKTAPPINRLDVRPDKLIIALTSNTLTDEQKQYIDGHRSMLERGIVKRSAVAKKLVIPRLVLNHYLQGGTPA